MEDREDQQTRLSKTMQARSSIGKAGQDEAMDLTPMVDVTFLLVIFFMITASFTIQKTLQFPAPETRTGSTSSLPPKEEFKEDSVMVDIDENGGITVEGAFVADPSTLVASIRNARAAGGHIKDNILITQHYSCPHGISVRVADAAKEAEIQKILIATEPGTKPGR